MSLRFQSEAEFRAWEKGRGVESGPTPLPPVSADPGAKEAVPYDPYRGMNKTEREYASMLDAQKREGLILGWKFEGMTLKLGDDCRYTPDFVVRTPAGKVELHEVKGSFLREDALVKFKVAADLWPFRFVMWQKFPISKGGWRKTRDLGQST